MLKKMVALSFAAALVFSGAACSDDDDSSGGGGGTQAELADVLKEDSGGELNDEQADCLAGVFIDFMGADVVQEALDSGTEPDMDALMEDSDDPEAALQFLEDMSACAPDLMGMEIDEG